MRLPWIVGTEAVSDLKIISEARKLDKFPGTSSGTSLSVIILKSLPAP